MIIRKRIYIVDDSLINILSVNLLVQNMNHIDFSYLKSREYNRLPYSGIRDNTTGRTTKLKTRGNMQIVK